MNKKVTTKAPYDYFKDNAEAFSMFTHRCYHDCIHGGRDSKCLILQALIDSIIDDEVRWEEGWVRFNKKGLPVCIHIKEKK